MAKKEKKQRCCKECFNECQCDKCWREVALGRCDNLNCSCHKPESQEKFNHLVDKFYELSHVCSSECKKANIKRRLHNLKKPQQQPQGDWEEKWKKMWNDDEFMSNYSNVIEPEKIRDFIRTLLAEQRQDLLASLEKEMPKELTTGHWAKERDDKMFVKGWNGCVKTFQEILKKLKDTK